MAEEMANVIPSLQKSNKKLQAIGETAASATTVNATQKRVLSHASLNDQDYKRQRLDNEEALRELSGSFMDDEEGDNVRYSC